MKNSLVSALLLLFFVTACQKDSTIGPADWLYQRWKLVGADYYLTFQPDGILLHGQDGNDTYCCTPRYFILNHNRLYLENVPQKSLPSSIREPNCGYVKCGNPGPFWRIISLDSRQLIIETPYYTNTYQSYP